MLRISDKLQLIGSSYLQQVIRIMAIFVMARFIGPNDNGIYTLVLYAAGLVMALNDFAIPQGVVQIQDHPEDVVVDTALVLSGLLYCFYGLFAIGAGIFLTWKDAAHSPIYWRIGVISAVSNLLSALYGVQLARLNRRLEFRAESVQNIIFALSAAFTGVLFAVLHYGAYALALQLLAGQLAANIALNFRVPVSWPRHASWEVARKFLKLGTPASIAAYVRAVEAPIIGLIIQPIRGTVGLGLWSKSIQVQQLFGQNLLASFQRVSYPLLVRSLGDAVRMRKLFARITLILMLISLLFTAVVGVNSEAIVRICLGRSWADASPLLRVTAWAIPAGALDSVAYILCMAMGITKSVMKSSFLNLVIFIPAAILVRHMGGGLIALAACWSASRYLLALTTMQAVTRRLQAGLHDIWKPLTALTSSAIISGAAMYAIREFTPHLPLPIQFIAAGIIGSIVYLGGVWLLEPETIEDAWKMTRGRAVEDAAPVTLLTTPHDPGAEEPSFTFTPGNYNADVTDLIARYPLRRTLPATYRTLLKLSRKHGLLTLARMHARLFPGGQRIAHPTGAEMIVPEDPHFFGYLINHEAHVAKVIREVVREGDTCVDVGANIGYFSTMIAGACGKTGRVICYEPEIQNFQVLEQNAALSQKYGLNLFPVRAAVSETEGTLKLALGAFSTMHRIQADNAASNEPFESVPSVNLALDLPRRGATGFIRFLKMDVEGHELPALKGLSPIAAARSIGTAVIEVEAGESAKAVQELITSWNARAMYFLDGQWHNGPISQIPCRTDIRIDFT